MKKFIYYPSVSVGVLGGEILKDNELDDFIPIRYYSEKMKERCPKYYHPYYLVTAGHFYKKDTYSVDAGLVDTGVDVFGDSGGYQIATGAIEFSDEMIDKIYTWLERNAQVAPIIDIPPMAVMNSKRFTSYDQCLNTTYDNAKKLLERPKTDTDFLNVMQGFSYSQIDQWFTKMNELKLDGWAISGVSKINLLFYKLAVLKASGELDREGMKYIHIFGISKVSDFIILSKLQNILNKITNGRVQLSTDSSSPGRGAAFGTYYMDYDLKKMTFNSTTFSNKNMEFIDDAKLPCDCPVCENTTFSIIKNFNTATYSRMIIHNIFKFVDLYHKVDKVVNSHQELQNDVFDKKFIKVLDSLEAIMTSDNPVVEYRKHIGLYGEIKAKQEIEAKSNNLDSFTA